MSMNFGEALAMLKEGNLVAREGWNGKNMFLYFVKPSVFHVNRDPLLGIFGVGHTIQYDGHIDMKTAQNTCVPWLASQGDLLAEDWKLVHLHSEGEQA